MAGGDNINENGGDVDAGQSSHYLSTLPMAVKQKVKALKKYQLEQTKISEKFYLELNDLERKYNEMLAPLNQKRSEVVNGKYEPTPEECDFTDPNTQIAEELSKVTIDDKTVTGIPSFWLTCLKNAEMFAEMIQEYDEPILEHLTDISFTEDAEKFTIFFHFTTNEHFGNAVLTKEYKVRNTIAEDEPFAYEGPEIISKKGCKIEWKSDVKNVTQKKVTKKQKNKKTGNVRTVTKTCQQDSFFNFFEDEEKNISELSAEDAAYLSSDFEMGQYLKERLIPKAVLFFTGEIAPDYDYGDEEEMDEEDLDELDEDVDSDADPDYKPSKKAMKKLQQGQQPECKQQ